MPPLAISNGEVILIIVLAAIPIGLMAFVLGAHKAYDEIGKGAFGLDLDAPTSGGPSGGAAPPVSKEAREAEVRQLLEAKAYRQTARGETPLAISSPTRAMLPLDLAILVPSSRRWAQ